MMDPRWITQLEEAIADAASRSTRDANRLSAIADFAKQCLEDFGLPGVKGGTGGELKVSGLARTKSWDVAYAFAGKFRLLISLKSMWKNVSGTVPNRIDDLMGEAANVQQLSPEVVIGYLLLFDASQDSMRRDGMSWSSFFELAVKRIAVRGAPLWNQGLLEGTWFILFDSTRPKGSWIVDPEKTFGEGIAFFSDLLKKLQQREPAVPFSIDPSTL